MWRADRPTFRAGTGARASPSWGIGGAGARACVRGVGERAPAALDAVATELITVLKTNGSLLNHVGNFSALYKRATSLRSESLSLTPKASVDEQAWSSRVHMH
jgi:hypothetical protein